ncbi:Uncharacterised protein [Serratia fonticola]|uniref:Uncharacterized protein n=1 Tax=Serratia fonticola TaxID=47917 RepID=A0A4U9WA84_SERFO|nr:Uncharacterised protein [Serratia fonticola]
MSDKVLAAEGHSAFNGPGKLAKSRQTVRRHTGGPGGLGDPVQRDQRQLPERE